MASGIYTATNPYAARVCEPDSREPASTERVTSATRPAFLFALGQLAATPAALDALERTATDPVRLIARHATGDWGEVDPQDAAANDRAVRTGERILSVYCLADGVRLWLLTEADRSVTTLLLPSDY